MLRPGRDAIPERDVGSGLEALQPASFYEFIAEPAETKSGLIVAVPQSGDHAKHNIGDARAIAVALLETEIDRPADGQGEEVRIRMQCRRQDLGENVQSRERTGVGHQRQVNEFLDRAASEL